MGLIEINIQDIVFGFWQKQILLSRFRQFFCFRDGGFSRTDFILIYEET